MFKRRYKEIYEGDENWRAIQSEKNMTYNWRDSSTYIKHPPFFEDNKKIDLENIENAHILAMLGDSVTTDHISPAGSIKEDSPAGLYLNNHQVILEYLLIYKIYQFSKFDENQKASVQ